MRRSFAIAVLALWALVGPPGPAHAGGPTSVLISQPGTGQVTGLYTGTEEYAELEGLLTSSTEASEDPPGSGGTRYTMTWMIHDVSPWRIDSVHIAPDGTASVSTTFVNDAEPVGVATSESAWRAVTDGEQLAALLDRLFAESPVAAAPPVSEEVPTAAPAVRTPAETRWFTLTGWRWVVPGVVTGLAIGLLASRGQAPTEPRRELLDRQPEATRV
ncbi:MAG: hypothetical protein JWN68_2427 [Nocardioides sp.]|jgi:hypothetical protein|uniref:hypothetical protein n=1 Tax=Nocardioides sp. TaxID=35761 RepID=UPI00262E4A66|nr:hypothetical protein [Nocardioides sp.]MCW2834474.1 hypothetical protein [Nocardioides sp.]